MSVIGSRYEGRLKPDLPSSVAFLSYLFLSGKGDSLGDGLIPVATAALDGAELVAVEVCDGS